MTLQNITYQYLIRSVSPRKLGKDEKLFVELGFARFTGEEANKPELHEPLPLLALLSEYCDESYSYFAHSMNVHQSSGSDNIYNGWEDYLAFCLPLAFGEGRQVSQILHFEQVPSWANQSAEIVALHKTESGQLEIGVVKPPLSCTKGLDGLRQEDYHLSPVARPSMTLGRACLSVAEVIKWLKHGYDTPFCFCAQAMGPDIVFILRLHDGGLVLVALQAKLVGDNDKGCQTLPLSTLEHSIRTVTPQYFFLQETRILDKVC